MEGDLLRIRVGSIMHEWKLEDYDTDFFKWNRRYYDANTGLEISNQNAIGFAYLSDEAVLSQPLRRDQLTDYNGELYQLNDWNNGDWKGYNSQLNFSLL